MINNQIILLKFIQTNKNIDWFSISGKYTLSENFIQEFNNKVNWYQISANQKLSENFKEKFKHKLYGK